MKLKNAILGRGKGRWHLDGLGENNKPATVCLKPIRELLECCSDDTLVYDAKDADFNQYKLWCLFGPLFHPTIKNSRDDFLLSLKTIKGVKFGIVKNNRILQTRNK